MPLTADERDPILSIKDLSSEMAQRQLAEQYVVVPSDAITDVERIREIKFGLKDAFLEMSCLPLSLWGLAEPLPNQGTGPYRQRLSSWPGGFGGQ